MRGRRHIIEDRATRPMGGAQYLVEQPRFEESCAYDRHLSRARLRAATTGRQALTDLLNGLIAPDLVLTERTTLPPTLHGLIVADLAQRMDREWRFSLRCRIYERLERAVTEGELPEKADIEVLCCLCTSFACGLATSLEDGIGTESLANAIALFVESLGFHKVRAAKRRPRNSSRIEPSGLTLVKP